MAIYQVKLCSGSTTEIWEIPESLGIPVTGTTSVLSDDNTDCYTVEQLSNGIATKTAIILFDNCEDCHNTDDVLVSTTTWSGCSTGNLYKLYDTNLGQNISGEIGVVSGFTATNILSGTLSDTCLTAVDGDTSNTVFAEFTYTGYSTCGSCLNPTPTPTQTISLTVTPTVTPTISVSPTSTVTPTISVSPTSTVTPTISVSPTSTLTPTISVSPTSTVTPTISVSPTSTVTPTISVSPTSTVTPTITPGASVSTTPSVTPTISVSPTSTVTPTISVSPTSTLTPTISVSPTSTVTPTISVSPTSTVTPSSTVTPTITPGASVSTTPSVTPTISVSPTSTLTPTISVSPTSTLTPTTSITTTPTITPTIPIEISTTWSGCSTGTLYKCYDTNLGSLISGVVGVVSGFTATNVISGTLSDTCLTAVNGDTSNTVYAEFTYTGYSTCINCLNTTPTPTPTLTNTPTTTPNVIIKHWVRACCPTVSDDYAPPTASVWEITVTNGIIPVSGDTVVVGGSCYQVLDSTTNTPTFTVTDPPISGTNCEDCKTLQGIECITGTLIGCNTGKIYKIQNTLTGQYVTGATGTTINLYISEGTIIVPSGGQPENCFTFGVGIATDIIIGDVNTISAITCSDIVCSVTPTPSVSSTLTPTVTPTISLSPSLSITPTTTPSTTVSSSVTPTPTITPSDPLCAGFGFDVTALPVTPTPSISPTPSPTVSTYRVVSGETVVFIIDSGYFECGDIIKLEDCGNGEIYYVNGPIFYNGNKLTINDIFTAELNGDEKCVKYISNTNGSSTHFIQNVSELHTECCAASPTPTPSISPTTTPTITPTVSSSIPARVGVSYVYTSCTTNDMIVQTNEVSYVLSGQTFINSDSNCWYYVGYSANPYHPPTGFRVTNYSGNYFTNPPLTNIFDNCEDCLSSGNRYLTPTPSTSITTTPSVTPSITPTISVTPSITPTISVTPSITPTISVTSSVTPTITPSVTPSTTPPQEIDVDFDVVYESGSTVANWTFISSEPVTSNLTISFTNKLYRSSGLEAFSFSDSVTISAGNTTGSTTATNSFNYELVDGYVTSYEDIRYVNPYIRINNIDKYHSVEFKDKNAPISGYYIFVNCCDNSDVKQVEVIPTSPWVIDGNGIIIDNKCYTPSRLGGDGSDGVYYGPDFKVCEDKLCPTCPSPTPSVTPSITPAISITPTPTNPYYLICDSEFNIYTLECASEFNIYTLECASEFNTYTLECISDFIQNTPSPTTTPTVTPTPTITTTITTTPSITITPSITPTTSADASLSCYVAGPLTADTSNGAVFDRSINVSGMLVVIAGAVGGQVEVPDEFSKKVARSLQLIMDPSATGITLSYQNNLVATLRGDVGTIHEGLPTAQRVGYGGGDYYNPNWLTDEGITGYTGYQEFLDTHATNDMVWYSSGSTSGDTVIEEVFEHIFHTVHLFGIMGAVPGSSTAVNWMAEENPDWQTTDLHLAMKQAIDNSMFDPSEYAPNWSGDTEQAQLAYKEYMYLLNWGMWEMYEFWAGGSLSPEWNDNMRTPSGIQTNNILGYNLFNSYFAPVLTKPSFVTLRNIFQDNHGGVSGYVADDCVTPTPTPTATPINTITPTSTPTITPSTTTGDKTIYVYYPNL